MTARYINRSGYFRTMDGLKLFFQFWTPDGGGDRRAVVLHHGFSEHSDRYGNVVDALEGSGITIYALDARGHGRSEGIRGHAPGIGSYVNDLEVFMLMLREEFQVRAPVLLGHSMGGLVAVAFALQFSNQCELSGLATSAAALRVDLSPSMRIKKAMGKALRSVAPELVMKAGLDMSLLTHDKAAVEAYKTDPMVHGLVSASMGISLLESGEAFIRQAARLRIPLFMGHGQADKIASPQGSIDFFRDAGSSDKTLRIYPGLYHEIFNELPSDRDSVLEDFREWIVEHLPVPVSNSSAA
jgi:acylglycerol lipase